MTNEQLIEKIRTSQDDKQELLLQLYEQNKPLIRKVIQPYLRKHAAMDEDDLMQEAYFGIIEAADHYDQNKGALFATYMTYWIRAAVNRPFYSMSRTERMPENMVQRLIDYNRILTQYRQQNGADPSDRVFRTKLHLSQKQLEQLRQVDHRGQVLSLSEPMPGVEDLTLGDVIPDRTDRINDLCDRLDNERDAVALWAEVDKLDPRQAQMIRTRFQDDLSVREVADQMQLTQGKVRDGIDRGCRKLSRKRIVRRIAREHGFSSYDLFGGSLGRFRNTGFSSVEWAVIRQLEPESNDKDETE